MKLLDICLIGIVAIVCLSRFPSPLRSLNADLFAKNGLTLLSAVCHLVGLLEACDYFATRLSTGSHHPGWIALESVGWLSSGLLLQTQSCNLPVKFWLRMPDNRYRFDPPFDAGMDRTEDRGATKIQRRNPDQVQVVAHQAVLQSTGSSSETH